MRGQELAAAAVGGFLPSSVSPPVQPASPNLTPSAASPPPASV